MTIFCLLTAYFSTVNFFELVDTTFYGLRKNYILLRYVNLCFLLLLFIFVYIITCSILVTELLILGFNTTTPFFLSKNHPRVYTKVGFIHYFLFGISGASKFYWCTKQKHMEKTTDLMLIYDKL